MQIFSEKIFYAILIFLIGIFSTILISKISKIFFKRITNKTKTDLDDFIFELCETSSRIEFKEISNIIKNN